MKSNSQEKGNSFANGPFDKPPTEVMAFNLTFWDLVEGWNPCYA